MIWTFILQYQTYSACSLTATRCLEYFKNMKHLLITLIILMTPVFGQPDMAQANGERVSAKLRFLSLNKREIEGLWIFSEQEWTPIRVPSSHLTSPLRYTGPARLVFFRRTPENPEGPTEIPAGAFTLPTEGGDWLLMLSADEGNQLRVRAVNLHLEGFPNGAYRIFNLCDRMVALNMAGELHRIPAEDVQLIRPGVEGREPISVQFIKAGDPEQNSLVTTTWFHSANQRQVVFLIPDGEKISVRSLTLYPEPEEPSPAP